MSDAGKKMVEFVGAQTLAMKQLIKKSVQDSIECGLTPQEQYMMLQMMKLQVYEAIGFHIELTFSDSASFFATMYETDGKSIAASYGSGCAQARKLKEKVKTKLVGLK